LHPDGVSELTDPGSPEVVLADSGTTWPTAAAGGCPNTIACDVLWPWVLLSPVLLPWVGRAWTVKARCTSRAALNRSSPAWVAVILQVPALARVTVEPETVHTEESSVR